MPRIFRDIIIIVLLLMNITVGTASAAAGLMVWPSKVELSVRPGGAKSGVINVQNQGLNKVRLKVELLNCRMDEDGTVIFTSKNVPSGCRQWLRVEPQELEIKPGASLQLIYAVEVPGNAQGTFMGAILLNDSPKGSGDFQSLPGTLLVGTITGTGEKKADLIQLDFEKGVGGNNASALLGVSNTGSLMCAPTGNLEITDINRGGKVSFAINPGKEPVLPAAVRRFRIPLEGLYNGTYKVVATVDYQGAEILQGEATVSIAAGELISKKTKVLPGQARPGSGQTEAVQATDRQAQPKAAAGVKQQGVPGVTAEEAEQLNKEAVKMYSEGDYDKALELWQKILRSDPGHAAARKGADRARQKIEALKKAKG